MNNTLNDKNGNILNPKIPRYESRGIVATLQLDYASSSGNPKIRAQADTTFLSIVKI